MLDTINLSSQIRSYRKDYPDAIIIIYPHWGSNYKPASDIQRSFAHNYIDCGADYVIGHGAHTIQEAEVYKGKWIFYNLGNFIFNAPGRYRSTRAKPYGMIVNLKVSKNESKNERKIVISPIYTNNNETDYLVRSLDDDEMADFTNYLLNGKYKFKVNSKDQVELF